MLTSFFHNQIETTALLRERGRVVGRTLTLKIGDHEEQLPEKNLSADLWPTGHRQAADRLRQATDRLRQATDRLPTGYQLATYRDISRIKVQNET